jgi:4-amino-4-deoxy-L-arabinose transferase-like glycosyltransferase
MHIKNELKKMAELDTFLIISLLLGLFFCLSGITWGKVESWNPDDMALIFRNINDVFVSPGSFLKPPFHGYFNFFLSYVPLKFIEKILNLSPNFLTSGSVLLIWSRLLTATLFLGSITLLFKITINFFGNFAARIITIIFATSAGFIAYAHFLTADIPIMFWMLLAFYFSQRLYLKGIISDYVLAGFFTGIATSVKYNGLAIGVTIVLAHILFSNSLDWKKLLFSKKLFLGLFMVIIGFLLSNPFALLDYKNFIADFWYNYVTTPVYEGKISGNSYWKFFVCMKEIIGLPAFIIFSLAFVVTIYFTVIEKSNQHHLLKPILLILSVFLLYYYKFGSFTRLETRFVLPILPFWMMISAPFWYRIRQKKLFVSSILIILLSYNTVCSSWVGKRFLEDPRMSAQNWVQEHLPESVSIESTSYTPNWNALPGIKLNNRRFPKVSGRKKMFEEIFKHNPSIMALIQRYEGQQENLNWYFLAELLQRNPQYIAINSLYYERFFQSNIIAKLYPEVRNYFKNLIDEKYPYKIVFDKKSNNLPLWVYPRDIDFLENRMIIFARTSKT